MPSIANTGKYGRFVRHPCFVFLVCLFPLISRKYPSCRWSGRVDASTVALTGPCAFAHRPHAGAHFCCPHGFERLHRSPACCSMRCCAPPARWHNLLLRVTSCLRSYLLLHARSCTACPLPMTFSDLFLEALLRVHPCAYAKWLQCVLGTVSTDLLLRGHCSHVCTCAIVALMHAVARPAQLYDCISPTTAGRIQGSPIENLHAAFSAPPHRFGGERVSPRYCASSEVPCHGISGCHPSFARAAGMEITT